MDEELFYRNIVWYGMLLNVLLWIAYDTGRTFFGVQTCVGIVLFLLVGIPGILYMVSVRAKSP
jgi:hypothetical protein